MKEKVIELNYPRSEGNVTHLQVDLNDVRASDGIRISYDFDRDGWIIEQPRFYMVGSEEKIDWEETAFVESWARDEKEKP